MCTCSPVDAVNVPPHEAVAASERAATGRNVASGIAAPARASSATTGAVRRAGATAAAAEPADQGITTTIVATTTRSGHRVLTDQTVPVVLKSSLRRP